MNGSKVAMSEMDESLTTNMDMLADKETTILSKEGVSQYTGRPLLRKMAKLDTNTGNTTTQSDIEGALKFLVGTDADTDNLIDETMEVGACPIFNRHAPLCSVYFVSKSRKIR